MILLRVAEFVFCLDLQCEKGVYDEFGCLFQFGQGFLS
jgi:hypothetical protein